MTKCSIQTANCNPHDLVNSGLSMAQEMTDKTARRLAYRREIESAIQRAAVKTLAIEARARGESL